MSKPRRLTPEEIDDIVEALPTTLAATRKCAEFMRKQIQDSLRLQLSDKSMKIVPEGIPKLKEYIRMQHLNSLVPAGEPVGIRAAEAIGQPITQMSLNAFHSAGSSASVGSGIDAMKEIFNVSQKRKNENTFIHFKNKYLSFEDIIDLRRKIVGVTVQDLIIDMNIEPNVESKKSNWWYELYKDLFSKKIPKCTSFLRVFFDTRKLYAYDLTLSDIASKIDGQHIICIPSPTYEGFIDFYPNDDYNMENLSKKNSELDITEFNVSILFLQMSFIPSLKEEVINGIKGITQIFTDKPHQVWSLIFNENHIGGRRWSFVLNENMRLIKGIPIEKFEKLLNLCKIKILEKKKSYYEIELPLEAYADHTVEALEKQDDEIYEKNNPITYITKIVKADDTIRNAKTKKEKEEGIFKPQEVSELSRTAYYFAATSNGINLTEVLSHELIDAECTLSNNPHEVLKALGIEAARNFLISEYVKIIAAEGYINPRHVMICADFQTSLGSLSQITARGAARQQVGPLSLASYEMAMDTLLEAAAFGKYEEANSTSSSIYLGKRMVLGTGIFKMKLDTKALEQAESEKKQSSSIIKKDKRLDSVAQKVIFQELDMEGDMFNPVEDMTVDLDDILKPATVVERLKIKSPIPEVKPTNIEIPSVLKVLLRKEYKGESKKVLTSPGSPIRASSPKKQTLSEPGLPAIPDFTPEQLLNNKSKKKNKLDLDAFLNE
jgi:hypothetical protein